ncbi:uncharacterized protein LOC131300587 isoform X2 [Rhododendron vialii]|uniref:uncharacterized protein LOC131300587 isoform X2 n=1 Tax=Rhododendron vialii TaxID=182163 RepID=UPI00265F8CD3|nr:uncharacterized protein LOC131300587 isoform X2 [Rhododendron vialii]
MQIYHSQAGLEDLAKEYATAKFDSVRKAFSAQLAVDSRKGYGGGSDHSKQTHEETNKKKNKEHKKNKGFKVLCDGDHPDFENVIYVCHYALQQEEEEFRGRIELKVEWENLNELCSIRDKLKRKPNGSTFLGSIATMMKTYTRNWSMVSRWSSVQT